MNKNFVVTITLVLLSVLTLFFSYRYFDYKSLPLATTMNDQYNYLTYARNIAEHNGNCSNLNYPTVIWKLEAGQTNFFYKPIYPYAVSLIYKIFGVSDFTSILTSILAYIFSIILVYHISLHFFRQKIAVCAALSFIFYSVFIKYSLSAMMESFFVFACLLGFYIFIKSPKKWNFLIAALAVAIAFSVRETGLLLIPGYFIFLAKDSRKKVVCFVLLSTVLLIISSILFGGQPSLMAQNIIASANDHNAYQIIYTDSSYVQNTTITPQLIIKAIAMNCKYNTLYLIKDFYYNLALGIFIVGLCYILIYWVFCKSDELNSKLYLFTLVISACIFLATMLLYRISANRGARMFLFTNPFIIIACWGVLSEFWQRYLTSSHGRRVKQCIVAIAIILFILANRRELKIHYTDLQDNERHVAIYMPFLAKTINDNDRFCMYPWEWNFQFLWNHFPLEWSFIPENEPSMEGIAKSKNIDVMIIPDNHNLIKNGDSIKPFLLDKQFHLVETIPYNGAVYCIYRPSKKM